jgi:hypothetical protein
LAAFPKNAFTEAVMVMIDEVVDNLEPQIGHADIITVGVDQSHGEPAAPFLDDSALLTVYPPAAQV